MNLQHWFGALGTFFSFCLYPLFCMPALGAVHCGVVRSGRSAAQPDARHIVQIVQPSVSFRSSQGPLQSQVSCLLWRALCRTKFGLAADGQVRDARCLATMLLPLSVSACLLYSLTFLAHLRALVRLGGHLL